MTTSKALITRTDESDGAPLVLINFRGISKKILTFSNVKEILGMEVSNKRGMIKSWTDVFQDKKSKVRTWANAHIKKLPLKIAKDAELKYVNSFGDLKKWWYNSHADISDANKGQFTFLQVSKTWLIFSF